MSKKYTVKRINGMKIAVENKKWSEPMKPRVPGTRVHSSEKWKSRTKSKSELRKMILEY